MNPYDLPEQLKSIETRLTRIENALGIKPEIKSSPQEEIISVKINQEENKQTSSNWLAIIAVICFVLAAVFIIKLSIDSGWLTPVRQLGLAVIFAFSLIASGFFLLKLDKGYASFLPAAGIIVLYLTVFAAHRLYHLIAFETAMASAGLISLLCIGLYMRIRHDIFPITAAIGAYVAPVVLGFGVASFPFPELSATLFSLYYFIVCSFTFALISIWVESRLLTIISAYLAIGMTALIGLNVSNDELIALMLDNTIFYFYSWNLFFIL